MNDDFYGSSASSATVSWQGFTWNGVYHRLEDGDDPEPNAGVREPRRPRPSGPPPMTMALDEMAVL